MQILYFFMLMIPMTAVAAPITMAAIGPLHLLRYQGPIRSVLTPMADQVLGGMIMWVGQGVYLMFIFSGDFLSLGASMTTPEMPPINRQPRSTVRVFLAESSS